MADHPSDTIEEPHQEETDTGGTSTVSDAYKVLGETPDGNAAGILGNNTAPSGVTIGVEGTVTSADGYGLYTQDDAYVGGELTTTGISVEDQIRVDFTGDDGGDHGLEVIDRSKSNSEQISIKADPNGSAELVFQDTDESSYKWGMRVTPEGDLYIDNHDDIQSRILVTKGGPVRFLGSGVEIRDGKTRIEGADSAGRAVDATGGAMRSAGGMIHQQRGDPTTEELQSGETMTFNSDGSGTGSAGDLVYAVNDDGTIKTDILAKRSNAT